MSSRRVPGWRGRTRWDVLAEAVGAGWSETLRLAVLLVAGSAVPCGAVVAAARLAAGLWLRR